MKRLACSCLVSLLAISVCSQAAPPEKPSVPRVQAEAMVARFYKEVVARHPIGGLSDRKTFAPYLSKGLLHRLDDNHACFEDWKRRNPGTSDKPPFALELGVFSGENERSEPQTFRIEKTEVEKDGSLRVYVNLSYAERTSRLRWSVAAVVVRENGRPVVDDVIYLKDKDQPEEWRLSQALTAVGCRGPRYG